MARYKRLTGERRDGQIVVEIVNEGDTQKAFITGLEETGDAGEPTVYMPEEMAPDEAFRIVENKREAIGNAEVVVKLEVGAEWDPAWGELVE